MKETLEKMARARIPDELDFVLDEMVRIGHATKRSDAIRKSIEAGAEKYKIPLEIPA